MKFTHVYTFETTVRVPAKITVLANNGTEALQRVADGAWHEIDFNRDKATDLTTLRLVERREW